MPYQIVTDSSCNLTEALIDELELEILPLTFRSTAYSTKATSKEKPLT